MINMKGKYMKSCLDFLIQDAVNIGEILDIQICGAMFPEIFVVRREENR